MVINYSGQPYEPVCDMHKRTGATNILFEQVETIRIAPYSGGYKLVSCDYGFLKMTGNSDKDLSKVARRLNADARLNIRCEVRIDDGKREYTEYLPMPSGSAVKLERLHKVYRLLASEAADMWLPHHFGTDWQFTELMKIPERINNGLYLCEYIEHPFCLCLLAQCSDGLKLAQLMRGTRPRAGWKFAFIDFRTERQVFESEAPAISSVGVRNGNETMTQAEIDKAISEMMNSGRIEID